MREREKGMREWYKWRYRRWESDREQEWMREWQRHRYTDYDCDKESDRELNNREGRSLKTEFNIHASSKVYKLSSGKIGSVSNEKDKITNINYMTIEILECIVIEYASKNQNTSKINKKLTQERDEAYTTIKNKRQHISLL